MFSAGGQAALSGQRCNLSNRNLSTHKENLMRRLSLFPKSVPTLLISFSLILAACAGTAPTDTPTSAPTLTSEPISATATTAPVVEPTQAPAEATATVDLPDPTDTPSASTEGQLRLTLAGDGNVARFLVTEQLAGFDLPNDA